MKPFIVDKKISIKAPIDAVWDALTNPGKDRSTLKGTINEVDERSY